MKNNLKIATLLWLVSTFAIAQNTKNMPKTDKIAIYQIYTRLFGNQKTTNKFNGTIEENGCGKFNDITDKALSEIKKLGISHVWYTGIIEHATMTDYSKFGIKKDNPLVVKGIAGSPYAIKDYYDVSPDLAVDVKNRMKEFENLVERSHKNGLKVLIDCVPNHVARSYKSDVKPKGIKDFGENDEKSGKFSAQNNFYYIENQDFQVPDGVIPPIKPTENFVESPAKATGNDVFSAKPNINDWFETIKLNYGIDYLNGKTTHFDPIPSTWLKMRDILTFWTKKGVDGFRCDMAEMVPVQFWGWVIPEIQKVNPDIIFIAEIYNPKAYRQYLFEGKFDYLYDKVGLYDALRRLIEGGGDANDISKVWQNESGDFSNRMLRFLENHDEQRIASKDFANDAWQAIPAMFLSATLHSGPIMLYFGQELGVKPTQAEGFSGDDGRTSMFDYWGVPEYQAWVNKGKFDGGELNGEQVSLRKTYAEILNFAQKNEAISKGGFWDLQYANKDGQSENYNDKKIFSYLRFTEKKKLLFVINFDQKPYKTEVRIPKDALDYMKINRFGVIEYVEIYDKVASRTEADETLKWHISANSINVFEIREIN